MIREDVETQNISVNPACFAYKSLGIANFVSIIVNKEKYIFFVFTWLSLTRIL